MRSPLSSRTNSRPAAGLLRSEPTLDFVARTSVISSLLSERASTPAANRGRSWPHLGEVQTLRCAFFCIRNGAAGAQRSDLGSTESELRENFLSVLPDFRSSLCSHLGYAVHLDRTADRRRQFAARTFDRNDYVVQPQLWVVNHLFRSAHGAERDVDPAEDLVPMLHRRRAKDVIKD